MKLQKLCYFATGWHLAMHDRPLFPEEFQAWADGPVSPNLYRHHRGQFSVGSWPEGRPERLSAEERATVDSTVIAFGDFSAEQLSFSTHMQKSWIEARADTPPGARSTAIISTEAIAQFFAPRRDMLRLRLAVATPLTAEQERRVALAEADGYADAIAVQEVKRALAAL